jgi:hypothetical protein
LPANLAWVLITALAALFMKSTAYLAVPLALIALVLGMLPGQLRRYAWITVGAGALLLGAGLLYFREPAYWYRATSQSGPVRVESASAPLGDHVMVVEPAEEVTPRWLRAVNQPIPPAEMERLRGSYITLGFFMWFDSDDPAVSTFPARSPAINLDLTEGDDIAYFESIELTRQPLFFKIETAVPADTVRLWVSMSRQSNTFPPGLKLYMDGFILAEGAYSPGTLPVFNDRDAATGVWSDVPFRNLLRNGSLENSWMSFRPWADNISARILPNNVRLSILLNTLFDREGSSWYYFGTAQNVFETFWGRFGWAHVPIPGAPQIYWFFGVLLLLALIGVLAFPFNQRGPTPVDELMFLGLALLLVWFAAFARGAIFIFVESVFVPSARYAYPVIVPTVLVLVAGWYSVAHYLKRWLKIPSFYLVFLYLDFLLFYDVIALWGIHAYYA